MVSRVLVIDDEPQIRRALRVAFEQNQYEVLVAASGEEGLDLAASKSPDLILLDLTMPDRTGYEVCKELREWTETPIIVLSVHQDEREKVRMLDIGADDYITKPFGVSELLARVRAIMRRLAPNQERQESTFVCDELHVDFAHRKVKKQNQELHLTPKEYNLLAHLIKYRGRVFTHRQLLSKIWGPEYENDSHTLRVHIANLRSKIEYDAEKPFILTETGVGYRFRSE